jgi:hypothetical protein
LFSQGRESTTFKTMASYLEKIEADRQAQHSGTSIRKYQTSDGVKWEVYCWERVTELQHTSYPVSELFDHEWQARRFLIALKHR